MTSYTGLPHSMYFEFLSIFLYTSWVLQLQRSQSGRFTRDAILFSFVELSYLLLSLHLCADRLISIIQEL